MSDNQIINAAQYKLNEIESWGSVHSSHTDPFQALINHTRELEKELAYLRHFYKEADFGPAHGDVVDLINQDFDGEVPEAYASN